MNLISNITGRNAYQPMPLIDPKRKLPQNCQDMLKTKCSYNVARIHPQGFSAISLESKRQFNATQQSKAMNLINQNSIINDEKVIKDLLPYTSTTEVLQKELLHNSESFYLYTLNEHQELRSVLPIYFTSANYQFLLDRPKTSPHELIINFQNVKATFDNYISSKVLSGDKFLIPLEESQRSVKSDQSELGNILKNIFNLSHLRNLLAMFVICSFSNGVFSKKESKISFLGLVALGAIGVITAIEVKSNLNTKKLISNFDKCTNQISEKNFDAAKQLLNKSKPNSFILKNSKDKLMAQFLTLNGVIEIQGKQYKLALESFREAFNNQKDPIHLLNLLTILLINGKVVEADAYFDEFPNNELLFLHYLSQKTKLIIEEV